MHYYICLVFCSFLFVNTNSTLIRSLVYSLNDITNLWQYNWVVAIRALTFSKLDKCKLQVREGEQGRRSTSVYIAGCSTTLMVCVLEHTKFSNPGRPSNCHPFQHFMDFRYIKPHSLKFFQCRDLSMIPRTYKLSPETDEEDSTIARVLFF